LKVFFFEAKSVCEVSSGRRGMEKRQEGNTSPGEAEGFVAYTWTIRAASHCTISLKFPKGYRKPRIVLHPVLYLVFPFRRTDRNRENRLLEPGIGTSTDSEE